MFPEPSMNSEQPNEDEAISITVPIMTVVEMAVPRWFAPHAPKLFAIPTHMTPNERIALLQRALTIGAGGTMLEIGSYLGASTAFLGFAATRLNGIVHAVDPWTNDAMGSEGVRDTFEEFSRNTQRYAARIVAHKGYSADVHAAEPSIPCDMLFIDGDHSYDAVAADLRMWLPSLKAGGVLAMHDIDLPDVKRAFEDVVVHAGNGVIGNADLTDRLLMCRPA